jgi:hypothetical protein
MPSHLHETLIEMFRDRPALAAQVLTGPLGIAVPHFDSAQISSGELTDVMPTEYRADLVVIFRRPGQIKHAVVVEVQLRTVRQKRRVWPAYVATLHARLGCPVHLLVICTSPATAVWATEPIVVSPPGFVLTPLVLGPGTLPVVIEPAVAQRMPEVTVMSAIVHGRRRGNREKVFDALLAGLNSVDLEHANLYADVVLTALPKAARQYLEALMTATPFRYQSDFARRYFERGEVQSKADDILAVLDARSITVSDKARARIVDCTDLAQLDIWIRRAATVVSADALFD